MIQFNLLPDVKLEYVRAQRVKHTVISAAVMAASTAFVIFLLLFLTVNVVQKKNMSDLNKDIKQYSTQLRNTPDLDKILTIQSQLGALTGLHADKAATGRTFGYIQQLTPANVTISDFKADYAASTVTVTGQASGLDKVNEFVDTLKFTKYSTADVRDQKAFSGVVLTQFARSAATTSYTITATFASDIFKNTEAVSLTVPGGVTTRSVVEQPADIFKKVVK